MNYLRKELKEEPNVNVELDSDFETQILSMRSFLHDVRNRMENLEYKCGNEILELNSEMMLKRFSSLFQEMNSLSIRFHNSSFSKIKNEKYHKEIAQNILHPYFMSSPFPNRCYNKPLGYAGDYEMMRMIQRENAEGPNLFAKFINVFYTNTPMANSVKNRTSRLVRLISEGIEESESNEKEYNSLSIGCGPAIEVQQFLKKKQPNIRSSFTLFDFNEETLNFAVTQANSVKREDVQIIGELGSIHDLLRADSLQRLKKEKFDFVYCAGLFDYLSNRICSKLIKLFYSMLKPGGKVFVTNMHANNYDHRMLELLLDWKLIYRDENDMASLVPEIGEQKLYTDSTGINLCLEITKSRLS